MMVQENLCTKTSKSSTPVKVVILPLLASLSWKRLQIGMGMLPITTNISDKLFSRININDFERPWTSKLRGFCWFLWSSAAAHTPRMNCDEMAVDRLTVCEQSCYRLSRISRALAQISCQSLICKFTEYITTWQYWTKNVSLTIT